MNVPFPDSHEWEQIDGTLRKIACGPAGVWGINEGTSIY